MEEMVDVVVVGAGWQGIAAAKTYLDIHPDVKLLIIDSNSTIGGVWALENLYPGLRTQNTLGTFEYTWYPLNTDEFRVDTGSHIPGEVVHAYLYHVAENFNIMDRIQFCTKVISAQKLPRGGWILQTTMSVDSIYHESRKNTNGEILCNKLIVAAGLTAIPRQSDILGNDEFQGLFLNYKDLAYESNKSWLQDASSGSVTVIGGSKAAHDAVYWAAMAGRKVDWVIRKSGYGAIWMAPASVLFLGHRVQVETLATTRFYSFFSPCIFGEADGYGWLRWLLHKTWIGRKIVDKLWSMISTGIIGASRLDDMEQATYGLRPNVGFQWQATSAGTLNYETDLYSFVRSGQVSIHRKDIAKLSSHRLHFTDNSSIPTSVVVHITGWKWTSPIVFLDASSSDLGIPCVSGHGSDDSGYQSRHDLDAKILKSLPYLREAPSPPSKSAIKGLGANEDGVEYTPWRLYRAIAPPSQAANPSDRNLVFLGLFNTLPKSILSEIQALWAVAYLENEIEIPQSRDAVEEEVRLWSRWARLRYPYGHGGKYLDTAFDVLPYFDILLTDLQLEKRRKGGWWEEVWLPYGLNDYKGLLEEFLKKRKSST